MNNYTNTRLLNNSIGNENIQKWINDILEKYKQTVGFVTPPICEKILSSVIEELTGTKIFIEPQKKISICDEGILVPVKGGFVIKYNTLNKDHEEFHYVKIRETICHELAHILFYDCTYFVPHLKTRPPEYLCHNIARQLLLPEQVIKEKFLEKIKNNLNLIHIFEQLSKEFQVARILVVRRLTEDLSLLNDTMVTFWKYKPKTEILVDKQIRYNGYYPDPKLSPELRRLLPKYWRDLIHIEAWNKVVSKVATNQTNNISELLYVEGKRRNKGRIKNIPFKIQCLPLYNQSNNLNFGWGINTNILSVKKFDLSILENGK